MGTIYYVGCKDCMIYRCLDKFYNMDCCDIKNRQDALEFSKTIEEDSFRAGLLVSFMAKHMGHHCVAFNDGMDDVWLNFIEHGKKEDGEFWKSSP